MPNQLAKPKNSKRLTPKQQALVNQYIACQFNGTKTCEAMGYKKVLENLTDTIGGLGRDAIIDHAFADERADHLR